MSYYQLLKSYISKSGLTLHDISVELNKYGFNISKGYISQLQNGKTDRPATDDLTRALAKVTNGDVEQLLTASFLEKAPAEIKLKFIQLNNLDTASPSQIEKNQFIEIPVYENISNNIRTNRVLGTEFADKAYNSEGEAFAIIVDSETMLEDSINNGDLAICSAVKEINYNDITLISINGASAKLFRVFFKDNICVLVPSNKKIKPIVVNIKEVTVLGKVVELRKKFR
ncbi:LexA family protein [Paenibacillus sinopodophylli]|uniref:LexA family protein n=1 Tax=Paenibacillus sinopodophylli TaxID=1837342 RepID=UPI00110CB474|nr:XRE family transcriptional regulator [Paenibacillus sinopodophylli]